LAAVEDLPAHHDAALQVGGAALEAVDVVPRGPALEVERGTKLGLAALISSRAY
jgi:hypothetical protein